MADSDLELDDATHKAILGLCAPGDSLTEAGRYREAITEYAKAWALVPEPKQEWEAATWIVVAIADACFLSGENAEARKALEFALQCPGGWGNPFVHLRYGQVLFDADELDESADNLMRAYMGGGTEIFDGDDPRYLTFLKTRAEL